MTWENHQASIFNGVHVWSGDASNAAGAKVEAYTKAMKAHQQQLDDAITWCNTAASNIVSAKDTITTNVTAAQQEIKTIEDTAALTGLDPNGDVRAVVEREYGENVATIDGLAVGLGGKPGVPASPATGRESPIRIRPAEMQPPLEPNRKARCELIGGEPLAQRRVCAASRQSPSSCRSIPVGRRR